MSIFFRKGIYMELGILFTLAHSDSSEKLHFSMLESFFFPLEVHNIGLESSDVQNN